MAQYEVFPNPSRSDADGIPYVVIIQSDLLDALATRLTMPLAELDMAVKVPSALCPAIVVKGKRLHALAQYAAPLPARLLKRPVDNVAAQASALVSAKDHAAAAFHAHHGFSATAANPLFLYLPLAGVKEWIQGR